MTNSFLEVQSLRLTVWAVALVLGRAPSLKAQSSGDTTHALQALGRAIRAETKHKIVIHNGIGSHDEEASLHPDERARRGRLIGLVASAGGMDARDLSSLSRQQLVDLSTVIPHVYRVLSIRLTDHDGEVIIGTLRYDKRGSDTEYGQGRRRYTLARRGGTWLVTGISIIEFSDGILESQ
jgi:hypothetical protein